MCTRLCLNYMYNWYCAVLHSTLWLVYMCTCVMHVYAIDCNARTRTVHTCVIMCVQFVSGAAKVADC